MSDNTPTTPNPQSSPFSGDPSGQQPYGQPSPKPGSSSPQQNGSPQQQGGDSTYPDASHYSQTPREGAPYPTSNGNDHPYGYGNQDTSYFQQPTSTPGQQWNGPAGPAGYPPYATNGYGGYPQYPASGPYSNPYDMASDRWNTLCIVGFILTFIIPVAGLILSIIAFNQIKRTGEKSRGLSIAGIIVGGISTVFSILVILAIFWLIGLTAIGTVSDDGTTSYCYGNDCSQTQDDLTASDNERYATDSQNTNATIIPAILQVSVNTSEALVYRPIAQL